MRIALQSAAVAAGMLALSSCMVGPRYNRP